MYRKTYFIIKNLTKYDEGTFRWQTDKFILKKTAKYLHTLVLILQIKLKGNGSAGHMSKTW